MSFDRRSFLTGTLGGLGALALAGCSSKAASRQAGASGTSGAPGAAATAPGSDGAPASADPVPPRSLLLLGGTGFLGPHIVEAALARGHKVTLFNRGKTAPHLFPTVEKLHGDRDGDLKALERGRWDAVVDTSGYVPRIVRASAELLAARVERYLFISTISAYASFATKHMTETAPLKQLADPRSEAVDKDYGALKAACEATVESVLPGRAVILRPGVITGPLDPTGRFTHWVTRLAEGGEVLAPGDGRTLIQWIDGRDLAEWIVHLIEREAAGTYNAIGPQPAPALRELLATCNAVSGNKATLTWVPADFLEQQQVAPWSELPLWFHPAGEFAGFGTISNERALAAGLRFREPGTTAADTLAWVRALPADAPAKLRGSGLTREKEAAVLAAWHRR